MSWLVCLLFLFDRSVFSFANRTDRPRRPLQARRRLRGQWIRVRIAIDYRFLVGRAQRLVPDQRSCLPDRLLLPREEIDERRPFEWRSGVIHHAGSSTGPFPVL